MPISRHQHYVTAISAKKFPTPLQKLRLQVFTASFFPHKQTFLSYSGTKGAIIHFFPPWFTKEEKAKDWNSHYTSNGLMYSITWYAWLQTLNNIRYI